MPRPVAVAITGGIGAGKSEALAAFGRHGAATVSSDELVHRLIATDEEVRSALLARFRTADRAEIARIVFSDRGELEWLESLLHPRARKLCEAWLAEVEERVAVVEIPLLYESGGEERFDRVVVITAPEELRRSRRRAADDDRDARLLPEEEKMRRADFAYVNDSSVDDLDAWVAGVLERLVHE